MYLQDEIIWKKKIKKLISVLSVVWLLLDNFLAFHLQKPRHQGEEEAREHVAHSSGTLHTHWSGGWSRDTTAASHWSGGRSLDTTAAFHWSDSPGHLLYEGDGDEDPLSEEDEEADDHEEDDAEDAGEGEPRVALLQEVLHNVRGPVQLK